MDITRLTVSCLAICLALLTTPAVAQDRFEGSWVDSGFGKGVAVFEVKSRDGDTWTGEFRDRAKGGKRYPATLNFTTEAGVRSFTGTARGSRKTYRLTGTIKGSALEATYTGGSNGRLKLTALPKTPR
ncbi:hypothetical protein [Stratiformator vulcanicus]|uniref:DUF2147 domain-containing protein n=1 Tax=Stratiformator vulcanicus TaxID=2527980 RepID=A0A517R6C3_9PLAN|nr:hypothetical protein [Stratiformator vulcanicus]QDT39421.1 hypothetical protein Pan189_38280 [Stratiformator vulcanicus]